MSPQHFQAEPDLTSNDWSEIEELLDALALRSRSGIPSSDFYLLLLEQLVPALGADAAAIWKHGLEGNIRLQCQLNLIPAGQRGSEILSSHQVAVAEVVKTGQPRTLKIGDWPDSDHPRTCLLHPFKRSDQVAGVLELVCSRPMLPERGRSYMRVLSAVAELAEDVHEREELADLRSAANIWLRYDHFAQKVHRNLEVDTTAYAVANEARQVVECDRISVLVAHGRQMRAAAISGVDTLQRRSNVVRALEQLASRAAACDELIWYHDGISDLPEEIAEPLDSYLEESHARVLAVVPLHAPEENASGPRVIGVLVAEQFQASSDAETIRQRVVGVSGHAATALHNAVRHSRLPFAHLGRLISRIRWLGEARQLPKTAIAIASLLAASTALLLVSADFTIESRGELQPLIRRDVFASDDGVVNDLLIRSDQMVKSGQPLLVLRKSELELEGRRITGEMQTVEKKLASVRAERLQDADADAERRRSPHELAAEEEELKSTLAGLAAQRTIVDEQQRALTICSPIDGQALTWNIEQLLTSRPVQRGQALLSVADMSGPWILELHVSDDRAGHVLQARDTLRPDLDVDFVLPSDPRQEFHGRIEHVASTTELDSKKDSTVLVSVTFDKRELPMLRPGATAIARIHCGRRSLGYVWLHDLFEYAQSLWW